MTNEEAKEWCNQFTDNVVKCMKMEPKYFDALKAMETCVKALDYAEHYKYHDLLEDPNDLPEDGANVLVCYIGGDNDWYETLFYDASRQVFSLYGGTEFAKTRKIAKNETDFGSVIGWCYICPFEVKMMTN